LVPVDRDTPLLLPPNPRKWVAVRDLVHFVLDAVHALDLRQVKVNTRGAAANNTRPACSWPCSSTATPPAPSAAAASNARPPWRAPAPKSKPVPGASVGEVMRHRLRTRAGKTLYKLRQQTVEAVFGIIKSVMGFAQFRLRGREKVSLEWTLICLADNLKLLHRLCPALKRAMAS
jgi:hypothetical protein